MSYYETCSKCGATLDPGERCDCEKEQHIRVIVKAPGEEPVCKEIENTLESFQNAIGGGWIETIDAVNFIGIGRKIVTVCDEEGKIKGLTPNLELHAWPNGDIVRGTVVLTIGTLMGEFDSMTADEIVCGLAYLRMTAIKEEADEF